MLSNTWPDNDSCSHLMSNNKCLLGRCIYTKYTCVLTSLMARPMLGWNGAKTSTMSSLFRVVHSLGKGSTACLLTSLSQTPLVFQTSLLSPWSEAKISASPHHRLSKLPISQAVWREGSVWRALVTPVTQERHRNSSAKLPFAVFLMHLYKRALMGFL